LARDRGAADLRGCQGTCQEGFISGALVCQ